MSVMCYHNYCTYRCKNRLPLLSPNKWKNILKIYPAIALDDKNHRAEFEINVLKKKLKKLLKNRRKYPNNLKLPTMSLLIKA